MTRFRLKFIHAYVDRHGHARHYFRRRGSPKVALPGLPGSREFMEAYQCALAGQPGRDSPALNRAESRGGAVPGSVEALVASFLASADLLSLKPASQRAYRGILERFRSEHGDKPVALLAKRHIRDMIAERASTPVAANNFIGVIRLLMAFAVDAELITDNPVLGIRRLKVRSEGYHPWTDEEIAQFEAHWPIGTKARLAFALHLYTGQRRSDVIRMTWRSINQGKIWLTQQKTGAKLDIPIHAALAAALDVAPREHIAILVTPYGRPFSVDGYGGWFKRMTRAAGLPGECASHGLRKAAARRLAEAGCTAHEIAAITGHASLTEVERYTKDANKSKLGESAIGKLKK